MLAICGMPQMVTGKLLGRQTKHRQLLQVFTLAKHLACLLPGTIKQNKQRGLAGSRLRLMQQLLLRTGISMGKYHVRLPARISQQLQQSLGRSGTRPDKSTGLRHHISYQPAGIARLEQFAVMHQQTKRSVGCYLWLPATNTILQCYPAARTTSQSGTTRTNWALTQGQPLFTQLSDRMRHQWFLKVSHENFRPRLRRHGL